MARGQHKWWQEPPAWAWAAMAVGLVAIVVLGFLASNRSGPPGFTPTARAEPTETAADEPPVAVVLGDSWGEGTGAASGQGFADQLAHDFGWELVNLSEGGTGYVTDGPVELPERAPFPDRVPAVVDAQPDVVIVAGGINDTDRAYSEDRIRTGITGTLTALQQGLPEAQIVVVGPWWPTGYPTDSALQVDDIVTDVATSLGLPVVSPIDQQWITGTSDGAELGNRVEFIGPDGAHPSQAGHGYLADRLYEWLRTVPGLPAAA